MSNCIASVSCHPANNGFTLLEILLVLMIMGLVAGVALPRLNGLYDSVQSSYQRDDVLLKIAGLGYQAFQRGEAFELVTYPNPDGEDWLELPAGWQIKTEQAIRYRANGVCEGGELSLLYQTLEYKIQLTPPYCQPTVL